MREETDERDRMDDEKEIDLLELGMKLWAQRKRLIKWSLIGAVIGLVVAFSIPKEYDANVKLAPETTSTKSASGGLAGLAAMAGLGSLGQSGADAVYPTLYPDVVSSVPFVISLFDVPVENIDGDNKTTVRLFLEEDTKAPWWGTVMGLPFKLIGLVRGGDKEDEADAKGHKTNPFSLTPKEDKLVEAINKRVSASVDTKTSVVTISVKMQDAKVAALLADTVVARLQEYVTEYRTNKARKDLEYINTLNEEAKQNYYEAQEKLARYQDRNQGLVLRSAETTKERLENDAQLAFSLYNQTSEQLQAAKAKVQENTPVYATISPASVPVRPSSPKKVFILIGFTFLAFVACSAWILFGKPFVDEMKAKKAEAESAE